MTGQPTPLPHRLHAALHTATAMLDLSLDNRQLEALALELTPMVRALCAESAAAAAEDAPVRYAVAHQDDGPTDVEVTEYAGRVSRIGADVDADSPAATLAAHFREHQHDVVVTDVPTATYLGLTVRPQSLTSWEWWLEHCGVAADAVTVQGTDAYAVGVVGDVAVQLCGVGVGLMLAEADGRPGLDLVLDSPAGTVAAKARRQPDVTAVEIRDAHTVGLTVYPRSLMEWQWWLKELAVSPGSVSFEGTAAVATGSKDGATVHLRGDDARAFYDDAAAARLAGLITDQAQS
ncbi:hypothetical protein [Streptomyces longwoodensis]|uniref:hypothetical protein n=1 Tax=Streptomyces longwoodensis TaxID=68231 RepID=UPI00225B726D|nr:hypothetical protein [Streptomyces longwoodensis]MCX4993796.1 hypothetical protein [Streptomyces longwoodensis]MCX4998084.1 hypothetical protein [Streptomyces longwoodensis]